MSALASTPPLVDVTQNESIIARIIERATSHPDHIAFLLPSSPQATKHHDTPGGLSHAAHETDDGQAASKTLHWHTPVQVRSAEFLQHVRGCAAWLVQQGVSVGERVGVMAPSCYAWTVVDCAVQWIGGVVVPLYETSSVQQVAAMCEQVGVRCAFACADTAPIVLEAGVAEDRVWLIDPHASIPETSTPHCEVDEELGLVLDERVAALNADAPATIVFTSGTTGQSKPAVISHRNMLSQVANVAAAYREIVHDRGSTLIFLPLAHILARGLQCVCLTEGMRISYEPRPQRVIDALAHVHPTFMVAPPRLLEKIVFAAGQAADCRHLGWLWPAFERQAVEQGRRAEVADLEARGLHVPADSARSRAPRRMLAWAAGQALFGAALRKKLGGRMEFFLSGAAPLNPEVSWFFRGLGVAVVEGYGLTETTAPATGNRPGAVKSGSVGPVIPGTTVKIDAEGRVLLKGPGVFGGYVDGTGLDSDGFFDTGDLGVLDEDGYLTITGRAKNLIITSYGKNISPDSWQSALEMHPLVDCALVVGDGKPYVTALVMADSSVRAVSEAEAFPLESSGEGEGPVVSVVSDCGVVAEIGRAIELANARVSNPERVRAFRVLRFEREGHAMTATRKLRRPVMESVCADLIEGMYEPVGEDANSVWNTT